MFRRLADSTNIIVSPPEHHRCTIPTFVATVAFILAFIIWIVYTLVTDLQAPPIYNTFYQATSPIDRKDFNKDYSYRTVELEFVFDNPDNAHVRMLFDSECCEYIKEDFPDLNITNEESEGESKDGICACESSFGSMSMRLPLCASKKVTEAFHGLAQAEAGISVYASINATLEYMVICDSNGRTLYSCPYLDECTRMMTTLAPALVVDEVKETTTSLGVSWMQPLVGAPIYVDEEDEIGTQFLRVVLTDMCVVTEITPAFDFSVFIANAGGMGGMILAIVVLVMAVFHNIYVFKKNEDASIKMDNH